MSKKISQKKSQNIIQNPKIRGKRMLKKVDLRIKVNLNRAVAITIPDNPQIVTQAL